MSSSRFYLVMISEVSLDCISLSAIYPVLACLSGRVSTPSLVLAFSILAFILERVLIMLLQVSWSCSVRSSSLGAGDSSGWFSSACCTSQDIFDLIIFNFTTHTRLLYQLGPDQRSAFERCISYTNSQYFLKSYNPMQKRDYKQFQDESGAEIPSYPRGVPVGQPIAASPYLPNAPQVYEEQQSYSQPQMLYNQGQPAQFVQPTFQPIHINGPAPVPFPMQAPNIQMPMAQNYGYPITITCPCCKMTVPTVVNQENGNTTYLWCTFLGCCVSPLCCCVPFLMDSCLDKNHYCPNCGNNVLRKHQRCFEFIGC